MAGYGCGELVQLQEALWDIWTFRMARVFGMSHFVQCRENEPFRLDEMAHVFAMFCSCFCDEPFHPLYIASQNPESPSYWSYLLLNRKIRDSVATAM